MTTPQCFAVYGSGRDSLLQGHQHQQHTRLCSNSPPNSFIIKKHVSIASKTSEVAVMQEMGRTFNSSIISDIACGWSVLRHTYNILVPNWLLLRIRPYHAPREMFY